jgi:LPS-assembly protein
VSGYAKVNLTDYWSINARSSYDLADNNLLRVGGGFRYLDECFDMGLEAEYVPSGETEETQGEVNVLFTVTFKNLGGLDIPY